MYQQIMYSTDLTSDSLQIGEKAVSLTKRFNAELSLVHVVEPPMAYQKESPKLTQALVELKENAAQGLEEFANKLSIPKKNQYISVGVPKIQIIQQAKALSADLLLLASYGTGGNQHSMGSTAQGIIYSAPCDVLLVNISSLTPIKTKDDRIFYARNPE